MGMNEIKFRVWHIPQIPMKPFEVPVWDYHDGKRICEMLADYDDFQFKNNIKPDYANVNGVQYFDPEENDWLDVTDDDIEEIMTREQGER